MSGVSEGLQEMRELKRQRHNKWQRDNMQIIAASGLQYTVREHSLLFREEGKPKVDFYPSTGRWQSSGQTHSGGAKKFIAWYKAQVVDAKSEAVTSDSVIRRRAHLLTPNATLGDSVTLRFPRGVTMPGVVVEERPYSLLVQVGQGEYQVAHEVGR